MIDERDPISATARTHDGRANLGVAPFRLEINLAAPCNHFPYSPPITRRRTASAKRLRLRHRPCLLVLSRGLKSKQSDLRLSLCQYRSLQSVHRRQSNIEDQARRIIPPSTSGIPPGGILLRLLTDRSYQAVVIRGCTLHHDRDQGFFGACAAIKCMNQTAAPLRLNYTWCEPAILGA